MAEQSRPLSVGEALGAFLRYVGTWLRQVPDLVLALTRPTATTAIALESLLVAKGLLTREELEAAKQQASAELLINQTVGELGQALEAHLATFHVGALEALKAVTRPTEPPA